MVRVVEILHREDRIRNCLSYIVNTMATDGLVTEGARASVAMVLTELFRNISGQKGSSSRFTINWGLIITDVVHTRRGYFVTVGQL